MAGVYWYLISTLDDFSRRILYGDLFDHESSWLHILAAKSLVMGFGCPKAYYPDSHVIFRYVEKRDSIHRKFDTTEEEAFVQWMEVLKDLNIEVIYAQSPQAKGKVERSYRWLQDHLVRTCARENITRIEEAREILYQELYQYNYKRVHSTTQEIPAIRFEKAIQEGKSFFRTPTIKAPYQSWEDIFCYRYQRVTDAYRKISWNNIEFSVHTDPRKKVELRASIDPKTKLIKIRIWDQNKLVGEYSVKQEDVKKVRF
jgi:hypothetical protein